MTLKTRKRPARNIAILPMRKGFLLKASSTNRKPHLLCNLDWLVFRCEMCSGYYLVQNGMALWRYSLL